ncbi:MAG: cupin domain-containing protein [Rhodocyclaceae bacterium]|nr:cupin domain-containing protein [Rhodocyclaceae bacterium]
MSHHSDPFDPDDEDNMIEQALSESLTPIGLPPARSDALRQRLLARAARAAEAGRDFIRVPLSGADWERMLPGVRVHRLDPAQRAVLIELAPGAALPVHRHHEDEECVVLRGAAELGDVTVRPGDYHLARPESRHGRVRSREGALLYLRGTPIGHAGEVLRDLVTALLPGAGEVPTTIRAGEGVWAPRGAGIVAKRLREDAVSRSEMLRIPPGTRLAGGLAPLGDECLLVEGDLALDDWAMVPGDYQLADGGGRHAELSSVSGAVVFVRSAQAT